MKKFFALIAATFLFASAMLCGCSLPLGTSGRDGVDGKNASAYDYYELAKSIHGEDYTIEQFLKDYINFTPSEIEEAFSLQSSINNSLRSAVAIAAQFTVSQYGQRATVTSLGSGVIVDLDKSSGDAYVLTNCHVIYNDAAYGSVYADKVYLYLYGQEADYNDEENRFDATVVGASITYDVALLKVTGSELLKNSVAEAAEFVSDEDIYLGEDVYTVGNAEGCGISATRGIITKDREYVPLNISDKYAGVNRYTYYYNVVRTDASINEGNSGGALFNRDGKIVALVNSKSGDDGVEGMGYAIPASAVKRLYPLMRESYERNGAMSELTRAHFVVLEDFSKAEIGGDYVSETIQSKVQLTSTGSASTWNSEANRLEINEKVSVVKDSYGLRAGDLITHITIKNGDTVVEDMDVTRLYHVQDTLLAARSGYSVVFTVYRGKEKTDVTAQMTYSQFT